MAPSGPGGPDGGGCPPQRHHLQPQLQMAPHTGHPTGKTALQVAETAEAPGKDRKGPKGTEEPKVMREVPCMPPGPASQQSPARHFVPFVAHFGGRQPDSFRFLFYKPNCSNSYNPFYTAQKPTCGYRFHRDTDHTKKVIDVPSANIVRWRPILGTKP